MFCYEQNGYLHDMKFNYAKNVQGCYCERLLTTGANSQPNGTKPGKDGDEKTVNSK